jgi:hypothetical protein
MDPRSKKSNLAKDVYLIAGSASEENIRLLLKKKFNLDSYNPFISKYDLNNNIRVVVNCNFHKYDFDFNKFENVCNEIKSNLKEIICLENLNPRPETMQQDMNILRDVFTSKELKSLLVICFTSSKQLNLKEIQKDTKSFNFLFHDVLKIQNDSQKDDYIIKNIKTLDTLRPVSFINRITCIKTTDKNNNLMEPLGISSTNNNGNRNGYIYRIFSNSSTRISSPDQANHLNNDSSKLNPQKPINNFMDRFLYQEQAPSVSSFDSNRFNTNVFLNNNYATSEVKNYNINTVSPKMYDGTGDMNEFIKEFESYAREKEWNDHTKANMFKLFLDKEAEHVWNGMPVCKKSLNVYI